MRLILILSIVAASSAAQAQFPYKYAPYTSDYPRSVAYSLPAKDRAPQSLPQAMLDAHNAVRAKVGVPPLIWSDQLAEVAQEWAKHLISSGGLSHRPDNRYGENIYTISGGSASPREVVDLWAAEARNYDARSNTCKGVCGHYTQVVWSKTRSVGCAVARGQRREVWVCNYDPAGNVIGFRPY
jgi:uncharacterized protein YkwD